MQVGPVIVSIAVFVLRAASGLARDPRDIAPAHLHIQDIGHPLPQSVQRMGQSGAQLFYRPDRSGGLDAQADGMCGQVGAGLSICMPIHLLATGRSRRIATRSWCTTSL